MPRADFENEGLVNLQERLTRLETLVNAEEINLGKLGEQKLVTEREIADSENILANLRTELAKLQETLEERNKVVDQVKKTALKSSKILDQALKEIALCVSDDKATGQNRTDNCILFISERRNRETGTRAFSLVQEVSPRGGPAPAPQRKAQGCPNAGGE